MVSLPASVRVLSDVLQDWALGLLGMILPSLVELRSDNPG